MIRYLLFILLLLSSLNIEAKENVNLCRNLFAEQINPFLISQPADRFLMQTFNTQIDLIKQTKAMVLFERSASLMEAAHKNFYSTVNSHRSNDKKEKSTIQSIKARSLFLNSRKIKNLLAEAVFEILTLSEGFREKGERPIDTPEILKALLVIQYVENKELTTLLTSQEESRILFDQIRSTETDLVNFKAAAQASGQNYFVKKPRIFGKFLQKIEIDAAVLKHIEKTSFYADQSHHIAASIEILSNLIFFLQGGEWTELLESLPLDGQVDETLLNIILNKVEKRELQLGEVFIEERQGAGSFFQRVLQYPFNP